MYKHIIWDFDGTLFDSYPVMGKALQMTFEEAGIHEPLDDIIKQMKISMIHALQFYQDKYHIDDTMLKRYQELDHEMEIELCKPYAGILNLCNHIQASGKRNYLYTHRGLSSLQLLRKNSLYELFTDCITSQDGFERKPSPNALNYLIDKYSIVREEAIMIGDRELDILAAVNAGIHSCYFDENGKKCDVADYSISNYQQLYAIIDPIH